MSARRAVGGVLLLAVLAVACVPAPVGVTTGVKERPARKQAPGSAATADPASEVLGEDDDPADPLAPDTAATEEAAATSAVDTGTAIALSAANRDLAESVIGRLFAAARIGFVNGRSELVSNNGGGIIGNNSVGIISANTAGLASKVYLISDRGLGYRTLDAAGVVSLTPSASELTFADRRWVDGSATHHFVKDFTAPDDYIRRVEVRPNGKLDYEFQEIVLERHANGKAKRYDKARTTFYEDGRFMAYYHYIQTDDETGKVLTLSLVENESTFRDTLAGSALEMQRFSVDLPSGTGAFRYVFTQLGLTETGTLEKVAPDASGRVRLSYNDPLAYYDGESRVTDAEGTLLYTKRQVTVGGEVTREYDLQDGAKLLLTRESGTLYRGVLKANDREAAQARMDLRADGSVTFTLTFPEAADTPLVVGYGVLEGQAVPQFQRPPVWRVQTVAGAPVAGFAEGGSKQARFEDLRAIAASRVTPGRFYVADAGNHRIRQVDVAADGSAVVSTYAGSGASGSVDGPRAVATFARPFGLAVAADDTIYVSEEAGRRIRVVPPAGETRTLAGTGFPGYTEGPGDTAQFQSPLGLALSQDGTQLFVADYGNHVIRVVATTNGDVSTLAGTGIPGFNDGQADQAQFNQPVALAVDSQGRLLVADRTNRRIRMVTGTSVSTVAGSGVRERAYLDGPATEGGFNPPFSLTVGPRDQAFFARSDIRFLADGEIKTYAGGTLSAYKDDEIHEARFGDLFGMAFGTNGHLFVTDGHAIRTVRPPGQ